MKLETRKDVAQAAMGFVGAVFLGSLLFAESPQSKPVRGEPIKPAAPRGAPIVPAVKAAEGTKGSESTNAVDAKGVKEGGVVSLGFDKLAGFQYVVPEYTGTTPPPLPDTNQIPASVKALDGKTVSVKGFMLPLKVKEGKVTELLLMRDQSMCCFGAVPKINEFLTVKMSGGGTKAVMDQAVTLVGKLKVGEFSENGYLLGIYQMDADRAEGPGL